MMQKKMRMFRYDELDGAHTTSEQDILENYFPWWSKKMKDLGRAHLINEEACVQDWVIANGAWEITG